MQTPCIRICLIDPNSQLCSGCGRTLDEIGNWTAYDDEERRSIIQQLPARLHGLQATTECSAG